MTITYIIRFRGTLTRGPNAGKSYDWPDSWGGVQHGTEAEARARLAAYRTREPGLELKLLSRQWQGSARKGRFVEAELPS